MRWAGLATVLLIACTGEIGPSEQPVTGGTGGAYAGGDGDGPVGNMDLSTPDGRLPARVWRLTTPQLQVELQRLFGQGVPAMDLLAGAGEHHLTNVAENAGVDVGNVDNLINGARTVATWAISDDGSATRCGDALATEACVDTLLGWLPEAAYRRPADDGEVAALRGLYTEVAAEVTHAEGLKTVIRAVLMAPEFLYRSELGAGAADDMGRVTLTDHEIATLLAYAITDHGPDDLLLSDAAAGMLWDADVREQHARRLLAESGPMWQRFFWEWLHMETFESQAIEVGLDAQLGQQMRAEYAAFVQDVLVDQSGSLGALFGASHTFAGPELAAHYGASHPGGDIARIELDPTQRGGLFTQGAWLVAHGKAGRDNVVRRGMNIFREAMCNDIRPPDGVDVNAELAKLVGPDATVRETVEIRGTTGSCQNCHRIADPVGMVFEHFASDGSFQDTYPDGLPVDTAIELDGIGSFDRAPEMAVALTEAESFRDCFLRRFAHFVYGRDLGPSARVAELQRAAEALTDADDQLAELLVAMVRSPAFIERAENGGTR